jgi:hypothetical protein
VDILEVPQYKPLSLMEDFIPEKTCKEYVEQDCAEALPEFRPHSRALVRFGCEVSLCIMSVPVFSDRLLCRFVELDSYQLLADGIQYP